MTKAEKLLVAALAIKDASFSIGALVKAAFKLFPEDFHLDGEPGLPSDNKVIALLCGKTGLPEKGLMVRIGKKTYALSAKGQSKATELKKDQPPEQAGLPDLPAGEIPLLAHVINLLNTQACSKFETGLAQSINTPDVVTFYGLKHPYNGADFETARWRIREACCTFKDKHSVYTDGRVVTPKDVQLLLDLDLHLAKKFHRNLQVLFARKAVSA